MKSQINISVSKQKFENELCLLGWVQFRSSVGNDAHPALFSNKFQNVWHHSTIFTMYSFLCTIFYFMKIQYLYSHCTVLYYNTFFRNHQEVQCEDPLYLKLPLLMASGELEMFLNVSRSFRPKRLSFHLYCQTKKSYLKLLYKECKECRIVSKE